MHFGAWSYAVALVWSAASNSNPQKEKASKPIFRRVGAEQSIVLLLQQLLDLIQQNIQTSKYSCTSESYVTTSEDIGSILTLETQTSCYVPVNWNSHKSICRAQ